jgi:3-hydroxyisobutyrate dehydrogenase-like beta-hydroxyacid dehydrogenase
MKVGFIGIGAMGKPMAQNLVKSSDIKLYVYDVNRAAMDELAAAGAVLCASPRELTDAATVIIMMLPNAAIVESTLAGEQGVLAGGQAGKIIIDKIGRAHV